MAAASAAAINPSNILAGDENNDQQYDLFISYEWGIKKEVEPFHAKLEAAPQPLKVWRDNRLQYNNDSLYAQLGRQIKRSRLFLFLLTKAYTQSTMCKKELIYAAKLGKTIICFMIEKMTSDEMGDEIGFIMGNCVYKQYYKNPKSLDPKKDVRHSNWFNDYFDDAKELILTNLNVFKFILKISFFQII